MADAIRRTDDDEPTPYAAPAVEARTAIGSPLVIVNSSPVVC